MNDLFAMAVSSIAAEGASQFTTLEIVHATTQHAAELENFQPYLSFEALWNPLTLSSQGRPDEVPRLRCLALGYHSQKRALVLALCRHNLLAHEHKSSLHCG